MIKTDELRGIFAKNRKSQTDVAKMLGITPKHFMERCRKEFSTVMRFRQ